MRSVWTALPEAVTKQIAERVGGTDVTPVSGGDHAEIAARVAGRHEMVFVKAASSDSGVRSLRYELQVSRAVTVPYSPAVAWDFQTDGWLVAAFEYCPGPHADLSPGSPDLDLLSAAVKDLGETPAPERVSLFGPAARLGFTDPAMDGDMLVHTDLNPANLIVTPAGLRIVDWAYTTRAAAWLEPALLTPWLIGSGHTPEQAETWLAQTPAWSTTTPEVLDRFASANAVKWAAKAQQNTATWVHDLAAWTGRWAAHRSTKPATSRS
ncbi:aminoglycoside phosphotransferase [Actinoplanes sp. URMC 104]|uniref:aminoglycoside phosphotransferase n=1 Tax=Actinoplanes sp. URMC 104 TaxID=3423409 RepID=UPI003F1C9F54